MTSLELIDRTRATSRINTPGGASPEAMTPYPRRRTSRFISKSEIFTLFSPSNENEMKVSVALKYGDWIQEFVSAMKKRNWSDAITALKYLHCADKYKSNREISSKSVFGEAMSLVVSLEGGEIVFQFVRQALNQIKIDTRSGSSAIKQTATKNKNIRKKAFLYLMQQIAMSQCLHGFSENFDSNKIRCLSRFAEMSTISVESIDMITSSMDQLDIKTLVQEENVCKKCDKIDITGNSDFGIKIQHKTSHEFVRSPLSPISGNVQYLNSNKIETKYIGLEKGKETFTPVPFRSGVKIDESSTPSTLFNYSDENSRLSSTFDDECEFSIASSINEEFNILESCTIFGANNSVDFSDDDSNQTAPQDVDQADESIQLQSSILEEDMQLSNFEFVGGNKSRHRIDSSLSRYSLDTGGFLINTETAELSSLVNNDKDFEFTSGAETSPITPAMIKKYGNIYKMMSGKFSCENKLSVVQYHQLFSANVVNNFRSNADENSLDESTTSINTSNFYSESEIFSPKSKSIIHIEVNTSNTIVKNVVLDSSCTSENYVEFQSQEATKSTYINAKDVKEQDLKLVNASVNSSYEIENFIETMTEETIEIKLSDNRDDSVLLRNSPKGSIKLDQGQDISSQMICSINYRVDNYKSRSFLSLIFLALGGSNCRSKRKKSHTTSVKPRCRFMFK